MKLKKIWKDPVWSAVIAGVILTSGSLLYNFIKAKIQNINFTTVFINFWTQKVDFWVLVLCVFLAIILALIYSFHKKQPGALNTKINNTNRQTLFTIKNAEAQFFNTTLQTNWKDDKPVGEKAKGNVIFKDGILNIERANIDGRIVIKLERYIDNGVSARYVKKNISISEKRVLKFMFQAKVIAGYHNLSFVAKKNGTTKWIDQAHADIKVTNKDWEDFELIIRVTANEDFTIDIHDTSAEKASSSIQIKNFVIEECFD